MRAQHGGETVLIAFTPNRGTVTAASDWDGPPEIKELRPAFPDSYEALFHEAQIARFVIFHRERKNLPEVLRRDKLERSVGAVYHSESPKPNAPRITSARGCPPSSTRFFTSMKPGRSKPSSSLEERQR